MWLLRTAMLLALIVWIGGIIFFAFVMAPTLFVILPPQQAGDVVSPSLAKLHWMGLASGAVFLLSSVVYDWRKYLRLRMFTASHVFIGLMLALTAISQFGITPRMRELRAERSSSPTAIAEFDRLHQWSTRCEGGVLLLGLGLVLLTARRLGESSH